MIVIDASAFRAGLETLWTDIVKATGDALEHSVDAAAKSAFATNEYKNHTWKLRSSTRATVDRGSFKGILTNTAKYASFVENGTKPHVIRAKNHPRLVFYWPRAGKMMFLKQVNHPGTAPRPFMRHAGEIGQAMLHSQMIVLTEVAVSKFNQAA